MSRLCLVVAALAFLQGTLAAAAAPGVSSTADDDRLNVIFVLADDWGWGDVGVYNPQNHHVRTPNLDNLAKEGTLFTDFHVANPVCSPSRTAFMTGQFPSTLGIFNYLRSSHVANAGDGMPDYLNLSAPTITRILQDAGYMTGHFGKWHLGSTPDAPPPTAYGIDSSATYTSTDPNRLAGCADPGSIKNCPDVHWSGKSSGLIIDKGLDFINNATKANKPFYLNLWFHVSHAPLQLTEEQLAPYNFTTVCPWSGMTPDPADFTSCPVQVFHAAQHEADVQIGRLLTALDKLGLTKNTLVVFSADNGPEDTAVYFNSVGSAGPHRGRKRSIYEGGTRVPFIARLPGKIAANRVSDTLLSSVDWLPTIAAMTRTQLTDDVKRVLVGEDMTNALLADGEAPPRRINLKWDWRFGVVGPCWNTAPRLAIRKGDLKLLMNEDASRVELYNMTIYYEAKNLASESAYQATIKELSSELLDWVKTQPVGPVSGHPDCGHAPI